MASEMVAGISRQIWPLMASVIFSFAEEKIVLDEGVMIVK